MNDMDKLTNNIKIMIEQTMFINTIIVIEKTINVALYGNERPEPYITLTKSIRELEKLEKISSKMAKSLRDLANDRNDICHELKKKPIDNVTARRIYDRLYHMLSYVYRDRASMLFEIETLFETYTYVMNDLKRSQEMNARLSTIAHNDAVEIEAYKKEINDLKKKLENNYNVFTYISVTSNSIINKISSMFSRKKSYNRA